MTRVPQPGHTKTRLIPLLGPLGSAAFHEAMLKDLLPLTAQLPDWHAVVACTPWDKRNLLIPLMPHSLPMWPQEGTHLGSRMANCFRRALSEGFDRIIMIGSDLAGLHVAWLCDALAQLEHHDVVLAPTVDGGYWLVGAKTLYKSLFSLEQYSHNSVFDATAEALANDGLSLWCGQLWSDVDDGDDLHRLATSLQDGSLTSPHVAVCLSRLGLLAQGDSAP